MKSLLIGLLFFASLPVFAQGSFMIPRKTEVKAAAAAEPAAQLPEVGPIPEDRPAPEELNAETETIDDAETEAEPARKPKPKPKVEKKKEVADGCTSDFNKAETLFKAVHGKDIELDRIGPFAGSFKKYKSTNTIFKSGSSIFLRMHVSTFLADVETDLPVTVCKKGEVLTAQLATGLARKAGQTDSHPMIKAMVKSGETPETVTLNISRSRSNLVFYGKTDETEIRGTAGLR